MEHDHHSENRSRKHRNCKSKKCSRGVKHHQPHCRKHSSSSSHVSQFEDTCHSRTSHVSSHLSANNHNQSQQARVSEPLPIPVSQVNHGTNVTPDKNVPTLIDIRTKEERLPESSEFSVSTGERLFSRSSSSTDYDIKVKNSQDFYTNKKWCVCVGVAILVVGVFTAAGIYFGYEFLKANELDGEKVFGGQFKVRSNELVAEPGSIFHFSQTEKFRLPLHHLLDKSALENIYSGTEVFLLETNSEGQLENVHFNLHFIPDSSTRIFSQEIKEILVNSLNSTKAIPEVELKSLTVTERKPLEQTRRRKVTHGHRNQQHRNFQSGSGVPTDDSRGRTCGPLEAGYCSNLPYNITTYPNMLGHSDIHQVDMVIDIVKEIVDTECYPLSYEMLCMIVQPVCYGDKIVPPCSVFCSEFMSACNGYIPAGLLDHIKCETLPTEADGPGACISKPGCVKELQTGGQEGRVCDGVVDCPDFSDELYCDYCPEKHFHCGAGTQCIDKSKMCDAILDCDNGADERGCVSLSPALSVGSYTHQYYNQGYLIYQHKGQAGKICAGNLNSSLTSQEAEVFIESLASSTCQHLQYNEMSWAAIAKDEEESDVQYVSLASLESNENFERTDCPSRLVLQMSCDGLTCGHRPSAHAHVSTESDNDTRVHHGDWPWHVTLLKEGTHVCDGTLIDKKWVMSTKSCFQGQQRAKWTAKVASVRLSSRAPWEQERRIIGMVASPVENHSIVLLKLDSAIQMSDFARPVCVGAPTKDVDNEGTDKDGNSCVGLGWDSLSGELKVAALNGAELKECDSESSSSSLCMTAADSWDGASCHGEMMAGHGLMCRSTGSDTWHLVGVSAWRRGCGTVGQRPRLYERVELAGSWIENVIKMDQENSNNITNRQIPRRRLGK